MASPYCWLTFRIRVPYGYVEKLRLLCELYKYRTVEKFVTELVTGRVEAEEDLIEKQKQIEIEEDKRVKEYWKWKTGEDTDDD